MIHSKNRILGDKNITTNIIIGELKKKRKKYNKKVEEPLQEPEQPDFVPKSQLNLTPSSNVITVNPYNLPVSSYMDLQKSNYLNTMANRKEQFTNDLEDMKLNSEPIISQYLQSGQHDKATSIMSWLDSLSASQVSSDENASSLNDPVVTQNMATSPIRFDDEMLQYNDVGNDPFPPDAPKVAIKQHVDSSTDTDLKMLNKNIGTDLKMTDRKTGNDIPIPKFKENSTDTDLEMANKNTGTELEMVNKYSETSPILEDENKSSEVDANIVKNLIVDKILDYMARKNENENTSKDTEKNNEKVEASTSTDKITTPIKIRKKKVKVEKIKREKTSPVHVYIKTEKLSNSKGKKAKKENSISMLTPYEETPNKLISNNFIDQEESLEWPAVPATTRKDAAFFGEGYQEKRKKNIFDRSGNPQLKKSQKYFKGVPPSVDKGSGGTYIKKLSSDEIKDLFDNHSNYRNEFTSSGFKASKMTIKNRGIYNDHINSMLPILDRMLKPQDVDVLTRELNNALDYKKRYLIFEKAIKKIMSY